MPEGSQYTPSCQKFTFYIGLIIIHYSSICESNLHSIFKDFDIVKTHQVSARAKRSADGRNSLLLVSFSALQKQFTMSLTPGSRVLHPKAEAFLIDHLGVSTPFNFGDMRFYSGSLVDEESHHVHASELKGVWMAYIHTSDELYAVEPLKFYDSEAHESHMVVYRGQDIVTENGTHAPFCARSTAFSKDNNVKKDSGDKSRNEKNRYGNSERMVAENTQAHASNVKIGVPNISKRNRRSTWVDTNLHYAASNCDLLIITDYTVYNGIGSNNPAEIIRLLVHLAKEVDQIFRQTDWGAPFETGYGITLRGFNIHTKPSKDRRYLYNSYNSSMTLRDMLLAMSHNKWYHNYCVTHLVTQRSMGDLLGLASRAEPDNWTNGICGTAYLKSRNIGASTIISPSGKTQPIPTYRIVVAHEIGHNWGATHDPKTGPCAPSSSKGGKYIMWNTLGLKRDRNLIHFSPCSRASIKKVLQTRASRCFRDKSEIAPRCGDGIVNWWEECDPGYILDRKDPCCKKNCRFSEGAVCSNNSLCCTEQCTIPSATSKQKCSSLGDFKSCYGPSYCTGKGPNDCTDHLPLPNGTPCEHEGECRFGRCVSFCELKGTALNPPRDLRPCNCDSNRRDMCMICCADVGAIPAGKCQVYGGPMKDNTVCVMGLCKKGMCVDTTSNLERLIINNNNSQRGATSEPLAFVYLVLQTCFIQAFMQLDSVYVAF